MMWWTMAKVHSRSARYAASSKTRETTRCLFACLLAHTTTALPAVASIPPINPITVHFLLPAFFQTVPHLGLDLGPWVGPGVPTKRILPNQTPRAGFLGSRASPPGQARGATEQHFSRLLSFRARTDTALRHPWMSNPAEPTVATPNFSKPFSFIIFFPICVGCGLISPSVLRRLVPFPVQSSTCTSNHAITRAIFPIRDGPASPPRVGGSRAMGRTARDGLQWKLHASTRPVRTDSLPSANLTYVLRIRACQFDGHTGTELLLLQTAGLT
jgi:hypothetical protein